MQTQKLTGIILNLAPHADFDRSIMFFSYELGRIKIIAKGVRKITSQRGFHLDLFNYVEMDVERYGNYISRLLYVREISAITSFSKVKSSPDAFTAACVIASFLTRILPEETPQKRLFTLTKAALNALQIQGTSPKQNIDEILLIYFLKAGRTLGYIPARLPLQKIRPTLSKILRMIDPQFTFAARRTLGIFSNAENTRSN